MDNPTEPKSKGRTPLHRLWPMSLLETLLFLGTLFVVLWCWLIAPFAPGCVTITKHIVHLSHARQIQFAWLRAVVDGSAEGNSMANYAPFEFKINSTHEFLLRLTPRDYILNSSLDKLKEGLLITNFSVDDPPDTVILVSRSMVQNGKLLSEPSDGTKSFVFITKGGDLGERPYGYISKLRFPPRTPVFLDP